MIFEYKQNTKFDQPVNPNRCKASVCGGRVTVRQCCRKQVKDGWCTQHQPSDGTKGEIWYQVRGYQPYITPVRIESSTNKTVVIRGRRSQKYSQYGNYYPSFQRAKDVHVGRLNDALNRLEREVVETQRELKKAISLKKKDVSDKGE